MGTGLGASESWFTRSFTELTLTLPEHPVCPLQELVQTARTQNKRPWSFQPSEGRGSISANKTFSASTGAKCYGAWASGGRAKRAWAGGGGSRLAPKSVERAQSFYVCIWMGGC